MIDVLSNNWQYLLFGQLPNGPLGGIALTIILALAGIALAFPISVLTALCCISRRRLVRWPATAFVYVMRGTPTVILILCAFFVLPLLTGERISAVTTLLSSLVLYQAAYMAEIVRGGILALPAGQVEAARSLGMGYWKTLRLVVLPQALYNMLPSLLTQFISTIKETSIGYVISVQELTYVANQVNTNLLVKPFEVFAVLGSMYFIVCFLLTRVVRWVEGAISRKREGKPTDTVRDKKPNPLRRKDDPVSQSE